MRTVIIGNRKLARHLLRHTLNSGWNIVGAVSPEGKQATEQANYDSLEDVVDGTSCRVHRTDDINSDRTVDWLASISPDICISGGWSQIIEQQVLKVPDRAFLGFHSSRLPEGRGGAPVNWSLIDGAEEVWISLFHYESGVDSGDVVARGSVPVNPRDDIKTIFDELVVEACRVLDRVRCDLEDGDVSGERQSLKRATYRPRRQPQDGLIDWGRDPDVQYDWVRAQTSPYPGAYSFHGGAKITVLRSEPVDGTISEETDQGEVVDIVPGKGIDVRSGEGLFRVNRVRSNDGPPRWADRFAQDVGVQEGDRFGREFAPDEWLYTGIRGPDDPTMFKTNLATGESGRVVLISYSGSTDDLRFRVGIDGDQLFKETVHVAPAARRTVEYTPEVPGTHTLKIAFENDSNRIDTRYLKVFVYE